MRDEKAMEGATRGAVEVLREAVTALEIGPAIGAGSFAVRPLIGAVGEARAAAPGPRPLLLGEALATELAEVTELGGGSVPELAVRNRGPLPILIPEGEVLVGARQNRVVNVTVLVPPRHDFVLPVSCVEAGRWSARSRSFAATSWANPRLRGAKVKSIWELEKGAAGWRRGAKGSDQARVWQEVAECAADLRVESATSDLDESMRAARQRHAAPPAPPELPAGTVGVAVMADGVVLGVDLWGTPVHLQQLWERLWGSYVVDGMRALPTLLRAEEDRLRDFLDRAVAAARPVPAAGLGEELQIDAPGIAGTALVWQGQLQHLAAFELA